MGTRALMRAVGRDTERHEWGRFSKRLRWSWEPSCVGEPRGMAPGTMDGTSLPGPQAQHPHSPPPLPGPLCPNLSHILGPGNPPRFLLPPQNPEAWSPGTLHSPGRPPCLGSDPGHLGRPEPSWYSGVSPSSMGQHLVLPPAPTLVGSPGYPPLQGQPLLLAPSPAVDRGCPALEGRARGQGSRRRPSLPPSPQCELWPGGDGGGAGPVHWSPGKPSSM